MPAAARINDPTSHSPPLNPGPGSLNVQIGFMGAWRAVPSSVAAAIDAISDSMDSFMKKPSLNPGSAAADLAKISMNLAQGGAKAAAAGTPSAAGQAGAQVGTLNASNVTLTSTWTAASAVPGGMAAANQAYTEGIKAAAALAASATLAAMAGLADMHICPIPCPVPPHGPGFVTKGSQSVFINNLPACRQSDKVMEACGGSDPIAMGCTTVLIGDDGGSPGSPESPSQAAQDAQAEQQAQAQSSAAALAEAAAAGAPLVEICPQCERLRQAAARRTHTITIRVVIDATDEPVAGVPLELTLPDGKQERAVTDADGTVMLDHLDTPGACRATCTLRDARLTHTLDFVGVGETRITPAEQSDAPVPLPPNGRQRPIARIEAHKVRTGETPADLASACAMTWAELAKFNWDTDDPARVSECLRDRVGCSHRTADGRSYRFDSNDYPGIIFLPRPWVQEGLATDQEHVIRVRVLEGESPFEVWVRAFDHWAEVVLRDRAYTLSGPEPGRDVVRTGNTDARGDLRERSLPAGEYLLELANGRATVAARIQETIGAQDGARGTGSRTWPDAVRIEDAEDSAAQEAGARDEPGAAVAEAESVEDPWMLSGQGGGQEPDPSVFEDLPEE